METTAEADSLAAAAALSLPAAGVAAVCRLLGEGATVAFISRYRKDSTGNLDETAVRAIEKEMQRQKSLDERRRFVTDALSQAGCLTALPMPIPWLCSTIYMPHTGHGGAHAPP